MRGTKGRYCDMHTNKPGRMVQYIVISPVRNEAEYLETTIRDMARQTVKPLRWILVNDGSTDSTPKIADRWASEYRWIVAVHLHSQKRDVSGATHEGQQERGRRAREAKEIIAFYEGYATLANVEWDFLVKLDGDVGLQPDYFERCFQEFERDPKLGIGGGDICNFIDGEWRVEENPRFHVRGATKIYRRACWDDIGGVERGAGWDTLDEVKANMKGWSTRSFPGLQVAHYRYTGAANGSWQNAVKKGEWNYISGYHPLFMAMKCVKRIAQKPLVTGSAGLLCGYLLALFRRVPQVDDKKLIRYIKQQQLRRLTFRSTIWK
ncbi:glycosyl transferase family 2 [Edaphobacter acidisoli]|uniref:Glycosyl transferase family 2 n=2 Tax=Edaphobacter acidisoli TaxID=2040573 RepID=A0A916RLQ1_9BACT|nr:glycosyl transferase family 2 [Edaphobacter acidisoli]